MTTSHRAVTVVALAVASLGLASTAHAGNSNGAGDRGGNVIDQSVNFALSAHGDSLFSGEGNAFTSITNTFTSSAGDILT